MARPKVDPNARQRTAQACESCKRRKQKCNGLCPCNTCAKRKFQCIYVDRDQPPSPLGEHKAKRRLTEASVVTEPGEPPKVGSQNRPFSSHSLLSPRTTQKKLHGSQQHDSPRMTSDKDLQRSSFSEDPVEMAARSLQQFSATHTAGAGSGTVDTSPAHQRATSASVPDEEALIHTESRMLEDIGGRYLYVGDSGTLSFVQLLRVIIETVSGPSAFTTDPTRHKMMETQLSLPSTTSLTHVLPDRQVAHVLIESFYENTCGLIEICEKSRFLDQVNEVYDDPLGAERHLLCIINMVFAIGLMLADPQPGTNEARIVDKLLSSGTDRAELFYLNAKCLNDPLTDFGEADFWNIQALLLMGIYMLTKTKRNAAFALVGMAIRSAHGLGLHREEAMSIFSPEEREARKSVWKSLFVVDRFLSSSLGRPTAIHEEDCSGDALFAKSNSRNKSEQCAPRGLEDGWQSGVFGINAVVRSSSAIGTTLKRLYRRRKISTKVAREIADLCKDWPHILNPCLGWKQAPSPGPGQDMAKLYSNVFYCHAILLLTRPFFLFMLHQKVAKGLAPRRGYTQTEKYSEGCVVSSIYTITQLRHAFEAGLFARRNPFLIYFLFAAAVVVIANEFADLHVNTSADQCIRDALVILTRCAEADSQAGRVLYMLSTFRDVVQKQREKRQKQSKPSNQLPPVSMMAKGFPSADIRNITNVNNSSDMSRSQLPSLAHMTAPIPLHHLPSSSGRSTASTPGSNTASDGRRQSTIGLSAYPASSIHSNSHGTSMAVEPAMTPVAPPNPLSPAMPLPSIVSFPSKGSVYGGASADATSNSHYGYSGSDSSGMPLDLSGLTGGWSVGSDVASLSAVAQDELIDFEQLWAWPPTAPGFGGAAVGHHANNGVSNDGPVSLFGIMEDFQA